MGVALALGAIPLDAAIYTPEESVGLLAKGRFTYQLLTDLQENSSEVSAWLGDRFEAASLNSDQAAIYARALNGLNSLVDVSEDEKQAAAAKLQQLFRGGAREPALLEGLATFSTPGDLRKLPGYTEEGHVIITANRKVPGLLSSRRDAAERELLKIGLAGTVEGANPILTEALAKLGRDHVKACIGLVERNELGLQPAMIPVLKATADRLDPDDPLRKEALALLENPKRKKPLQISESGSSEVAKRAEGAPRTSTRSNSDQRTEEERSPWKIWLVLGAAFLLALAWFKARRKAV